MFYFSDRWPWEARPRAPAPATGSSGSAWNHGVPAPRDGGTKWKGTPWLDNCCHGNSAGFVVLKLHCQSHILLVFKQGVYVVKEDICCVSNIKFCIRSSVQLKFALEWHCISPSRVFLLAVIGCAQQPDIQPQPHPLTRQRAADALRGARNDGRGQHWSCTTHAFN